MLSAITEKLQSQRINDEMQYRVAPSAAAAAFAVPASQSRPLGQIQNRVAPRTFGLPLLRNLAATSFGSKPAPSLSLASPICTKIKDKNQKENIVVNHLAIKSSNKGRQQRSLGSVPAPQISEGLPKISQRATQRPLVTFSAIAPRNSPTQTTPKRHCCSLSVVSRSQLRLIRPIARRPDAASRLSSRYRISSRNSFSTLSAKRSAFTPAPRIGGCHKASLMRRPLDKCIMARSLPEALSASVSMAREDVRICQSQPCFNLFVALTDPPLSSNDNDSMMEYNDDDFSITGRTCLPRESGTRSNSMFVDVSSARQLNYWADRPFCDLDLDQMEND